MAALLLLLCSAAAVVAFSAGSCPSPKFDAEINHTACLPPSPFANLSRAGVSANDAVLIVNLHNQVRRAPFAADMQVMVWDSELAMVAQSRASYCQYAHDGMAQRRIPGKYYVGQNIGYGYKSWTDMVLNGWASENASFAYGIATNAVVGHYTQMVWSNTSRVGCGATYCKNLAATFYVCNYAPGGNIYPYAYKPYALAVKQKGEACPARVSGGLCDCGGKTCYNGGTLNLNTCACTCSASFDFQPNCDLNCTSRAAVGLSYCSSATASYCTLYYNWAYACPSLCNWCPLAGAA